MRTYILLAFISALYAVIDFKNQCGHLPDGGPCRAVMPMWWFNATSGKCERFVYGGCGGNENRYKSKVACETTCSREKPTPAEVCRRPVYPGPCVAFVNHFYYDAKTNMCKEFLYGGCNSNGNNFETLRECLAFCATAAQGEPVHLAA